MKNIVFLIAGATFGFILHQGRVTDYDTMMGMFLLKDLHLMGVIGAAVATAAVGLFVLRKLGAKPVIGGEMDVKPKPMRKWIFVAGMIFGLGWALTGA